MKRFHFLVFWMLAMPNFSNAQVTTNPAGDATGTVAANTTRGNFALGAGLLVASPGCSGTWFQSENYTVGAATSADALAAGDYFSFTVSPMAGYRVDLTQISLTGLRASASGPQSNAFAYRIDGGPWSVSTTGASGSGNCASGGNGFTWDFTDFTVGAPHSIEFAFASWGATNGNGTLRVGGVTLAGASVLPIELAHFSAEKRGSANAILWQTASESNASHFQIERSADGLDWREIGQIRAAGESSARLDYAFLDQNPLDFGFYRLVSVDFDGSEQNSNIARVDRRAGRPAAWAQPVLVENETVISFDSETEKETRLDIFDQVGRLVFSKKAALEKGENRLRLELADLPTGLFTIRFSANETAPVRFFKS